MSADERAFTFDCRGMRLPAILHPGVAGATRGVLVVVGGPQYRVGSHRQFVLLARTLAAAGIPVLRFDYRGMGDAEGEARDFTGIDADIEAAISAFIEQVGGLREVVIWGLCDAASAALFYAWRDPRVAGLVLLNPWVRTEAGEAKAYLTHYYRQRLFSPELWRKVWRCEFDWRGSLVAFAGMVRRALTRPAAPAASALAGDADAGLPLPERMAAGWRRFGGPVLLILSGDDLTAAEFRDVTATHVAWHGLLEQSRVGRRELAEANHTFSRRLWRDQVAHWTLEWLRSW